MTGFHGNRVLQRAVNDLVQAGVTAFVETGTHYAATALYMARRYPSLPVFTCEIDDACHAASAVALKPCQNAQLSKESSEKFVTRLVSGNMVGDFPMFFLDAHWFDYWPLPDEVATIAALPKFVILVDDFMVPGQNHFETSAGGGGTIGVHRTKPDTRPCDMSLVKHLLPQDCEVGYPRYTKLEAYGNPAVPHLVGYVLVVRGVQVPGGLKADPLHSWGGIR